MSLIVPPPFAMPTPAISVSCNSNISSLDVEMKAERQRRDLLPKKPLSVLTVIKATTFGLKAVGICNNAKIEKHIRYNFRRPNVSLNGANIRGPMPRKTTKPVVAPTTTLSVVFRSSAI